MNPIRAGPVRILRVDTSSYGLKSDFSEISVTCLTPRANTDEEINRIAKVAIRKRAGSFFEIRKLDEE